MWMDDLLERVHDRWHKNETTYPAGYAIFYGPLYEQPPLLLIGDNPGGDESPVPEKGPYAAEKERWALDRMEYLDYQQDPSYPLAVRTTALFDEAGHRDVLGQAVKTNACFFRSRSSSEVRKEDWTWCMDQLRDIVEHVDPAVLLCESVGTFDWVLQHLYPDEEREPRQLYQRGGRKYVSYALRGERPQLVIGITHLTGSRPSRGDREVMAQLLGADLQAALPS